MLLGSLEICWVLLGVLVRLFICSRIDRLF